MYGLAKGTLKRSAFAALAAVVLLVASAASATVFTGVVYYTVDNTNGLSTNVWSQTYSYDDSTNILTLGSKTAVATCPGADGLLASPTAGHLFVGGENTKAVYDVTIATGTFTTLTSPHKSFHLTLSPDNKTLYSSDYYTDEGAGLHVNGIDTFTLPANGVAHALTGDDLGITQIAFAPTTGNVFYTASIPNCCGDVGTVNLGTFVTTKLFNSAVVHSIIYDPFTGLMDMFGIGYTSSMDQSGSGFKNSANLDTNFDQGSIDNLGHAFIAGGDHLDFLDYSVGLDITVPDHFLVNTGYTNIDDVVMVPTPPATGVCPLSQGYWKNHGSKWPATCLPMTLGTTHSYTESQLLAILKSPARGNASRILAYQLIAAKLNICNGADGSPVAATIADADSLIGTNSVPFNASKTTSAAMNADAKILDLFNNGCLTSGCSTDVCPAQ